MKESSVSNLTNGQWITVGKPGWFGEGRANLVRGYDAQYGVGNWRIRHRLGPRLLDFTEAVRLYELCYELHFLNPVTRYLWTHLFKIACDVWTEEEADVASGMDYTIQLAKAHHYEDVAIRIIMARYHQQFQGSKLIRIRADSDDVIGVALSSMRIPFIFPELIEPFPEIHWWNRHGPTIENFWHANKFLQIRDSTTQ